MPGKSEHQAYILKMARNFLWLFLQLGVTRLFGFIFTIILARKLAQDDFGLYTYAISLTGMFLMFSDLGMTSLMLREMARQRENAAVIFNRIFSAKLPLIVLVYAAFALVLVLTPSKGGRLAVLALATAYFLENMASFLSTPFKATEQMHFLATGDFLYKCFLILASLVVLRFSPSILAVSAVYAAGAAGYLAFYAVLHVRHFGPVRLVPDFRAAAENLRAQLAEAAPMTLGGLILIVYINTDVIMLRWMKGTAVTGLYGVSYSFYLGLGLAAAILVQSVLPRLSQSLENGQKELTETVLRGTTKLLFMLSVPLAAGGLLLAEEIIRFFYGARYLPSAHAFRIFMAAVVFNYINTLINYYLYADRKQGEINAILLGTVSLNVFLNFLLIPKYSLAGSAFATLAAESVFTVVFLLRHRGFLRNIQPAWAWRFLAAAAAMLFFAHYAGLQGGFIPAVISGAAVYAGALALLGGLKAEKELLLGVIGKLKAPL